MKNEVTIANVKVKMIGEHYIPTIILTRKQVEDAMEELNKPELYPNLARVQRVGDTTTIGVVFRGTAQQRYCKGSDFIQGAITVLVSPDASALTYHTEAQMMEHWKLIP